MRPHPHPTRHESEDAHMRLARNQVLGMRDYVHDHHDYKRKTCARLKRICGIAREATPHVLDRMIHLLTAGRLTVNFSGPGFFTQENRSDSYLNCFERGTACRRELNYQTHRDKVEKELFDYGGKSASYRTRADISHTSLNRYGDVDSMRREIAYYGVDSPIWYSMRPRYAALRLHYVT